MVKLITAEAAASMLQDEMSVGVGGFVGFGTPEELLIAIENRYIEKKEPKDLSVFFSPGIGDSGDKGLSHLGYEGLVKRAV